MERDECLLRGREGSINGSRIKLHGKFTLLFDN